MCKCYDSKSNAQNVPIYQLEPEIFALGNQWMRDENFAKWCQHLGNIFKAHGIETRILLRSNKENNIDNVNIDQFRDRTYDLEKNVYCNACRNWQITADQYTIHDHIVSNEACSSFHYATEIQIRYIVGYGKRDVNQQSAWIRPHWIMYSSAHTARSAPTKHNRKCQQSPLSVFELQECRRGELEKNAYPKVMH